MRNRRAHTARAALPWIVALACASAPPAPPEPPASGPLAPGALRVRLAFGAEVDLDLYVTGPSQETVYFGNARSREGGELEADRRCEAPAPRVETVVFPDAPAGDYRVGVDFMVRCDEGVQRGRYVLWIEAPGHAPRRLEGEAVFGVFAPRVTEFRIDPAP